jgi:histidine phosphotransfer protein HptB
MSDQDDALIDKAQLNNLKELFSEGFSEFVQTYFNDFESREKDLIKALENNELELAKKIAHALKGSSLNMGAIGLAEVCSKLEEASKQGKVDEANEKYKGLLEMYPKTKEAYKRLSL